VCLFTAISYGQWVFFLSFFSVFRKLLSVVFFLNGLGEFEEIGWRVNDAGANGGFLLGFFMLRFSLFFFLVDGRLVVGIFVRIGTIQQGLSRIVLFSRDVKM
jgi:hypothetical protein